VEQDIRYLQGGLSAWQWEKKSTQADPKITPMQLKGAIDHGKINKEIFLLDVREPDEFSSWNIEGSRNIPLSQIPNSLDRIPKDSKNKKVVTICPAGNRSSIATLLLQQLGFHKVKTLEGGLKSWSSTYEHIIQKFVVKGGKKVRLVQIRRIGKGCLSYILEADYEAAVIDPVFPIDDYIKIAEGDGMKAKINKVFDTHLHADHVSAARKLAEKVNAQLYLSSYEEEYETNVIYNASELDDGDILMIGSVPVKIIYSPGHTRGSVSLLIGHKLLFTGVHCSLII
ncbi:MAG: rhodanese-like domain-containing protein, partial [Nitrososphaeraceae archaeon]